VTRRTALLRNTADGHQQRRASRGRGVVRVILGWAEALAGYARGIGKGHRDAGGRDAASLE
jgi:hypothetical protein